MLLLLIIGKNEFLSKFKKYLVLKWLIKNHVRKKIVSITVFHLLSNISRNNLRGTYF